MNWNPIIVENSITKDHLEALISGDIPAIVLENQYSVDECDKVLNNLNGMNFKSYGHTHSGLKKLGACLHEHIGTDYKKYFQDADAFKVQHEEIFNIVKNPLFYMMELVNHLRAVPSVFPSNEDGHCYYGGTFRQVHGGGDLHFDFAPFELPETLVSEIDHQLTWNVYFSQPLEGGELNIYKKFWNLELQNKYQIADTVYFSKQCVDDAIKYTYKVKQGDLVFFNSKNFHEILPVTQGKRVTQSSFFGIKKESTYFWS